MIFYYAWLWTKKNINQQFFTFNKHKTSYLETFVITILYCSKSNNQSNLNIEKKLPLKHTTLQNLSPTSYEHTHIIIATSFSFVLKSLPSLGSINSLSTHPSSPKKPLQHMSTHNICSQPTYLTKFEKEETLPWTLITP